MPAFYTFVTTADLSTSVLNTFKTLITDEGATAEEDLFILDKMKEMVSSPEVIHLGAAKQLLNLIERTVSHITHTQVGG
jgi:hypothetical protein